MYSFASKYYKTSAMIQNKNEERHIEKTLPLLIFLHMALAFLLLQTGFTKGSEDC